MRHTSVSSFSRYISGILLHDCQYDRGLLVLMDGASVDEAFSEQ